jgi:hypothetical protein
LEIPKIAITKQIRGEQIRTNSLRVCSFCTAGECVSQVVMIIRKGFVCKRVPHVTLKSIANNPDIAEGLLELSPDPCRTIEATETTIDLFRPAQQFHRR